ncbi:hypothetical protein [Reyranella sp.]|jgi:hypothetical protein|uniref:hypothetical protein n=1 Tax=Reyranella sp. TaxID=1929291 RepID=UPI002F92181F
MTAIAHASIPADDPKRVAEVLAEMMNGEAMPFPPAGKDGWMAWSGDGEVELEISRRGLAVTHGETQAEWRADGIARRFSEVHLAICVDRPAAEVLAIAKRAGWPARSCVRGGDVFPLTEVWIEGAFMIEVLDPQQTAHYRKVVTPENWKRFLKEMAAD